MERIKIAELTIDTAKLVKEMQATKAEMDSLKASQQELKDAGKENSAQFIKNAADLKTASATYRAQEKTLQEVTGATKNLTNELNKEIKSLGDAEANNKALRKARRDVNLSTEEGKKALEEINKKIDANTNFMKENQDAQVQQKMNIGNYRDALLDATGTQEAYTKGTQAMNAVQKVSAMVVGKSTGALKLFRIALASTGVGLLVIALGSLVTYLTSTQEGINKVNMVLTPMKEIIGTLVGQTQELGKAFFKLLSGDFKGFANDIKTISSTIGKDMSDAVERGKEIERIRQRLSKTEADYITQQGKLRQEFKEQNKLAEDQTKSLTEREAAARRSIEIQKEISKNATDRLKQEAELIELQQQANDTSDADRTELATKLAEINDAIAAENEAVTTQQNKLNAIIKQGETQRLQYKKDAVAEKIRLEKEEEERQKQKEAQDEEEQQKRLERIKRYEEEKRALEEELALKNTESELERAELKAQQDYEAHVRRIEAMQLEEDEKTELLKLAEEKRNAILGEIKKGFQDEMTANFSKAMQDELAIRMQNAEQVAGIASQLNGILKGILGDSLGAQIAGIAIDAAIQAAKVNMATKAAQASNLAQATATAPPPLNAGFIAMALGQNAVLEASAAKSTSMILANAALSSFGTAAKNIKFEKGGLLQGASHANGGILTPYGELEGDEAVISKRATMKYGGLLSAVNMAEGGNMIGSYRPTGLIDYDVLASKIAQANMSLPAPRVGVDEIASVSQRAVDIQEKARF